MCCRASGYLESVWHILAANAIGIAAGMCLYYYIGKFALCDNKICFGIKKVLTYLQREL